MDITNELLAAYAEGNVTPEERKQVREYLVEHPSQLESVMLMMDDDDDLEVKEKRKDVTFMGMRPPRMRNISFAGAAFLPPVSSIHYDMMESTEEASPITFYERLDDLLDELI